MIIVMLLSLFVVDMVVAQDITSVKFEGLKKTKESYLKSLIHTQVNQLLDSSLLKKDRQTLKNLEIIYHADFKVIATDRGVEIIFYCEESTTLLPIFSFDKIENATLIKIGFSESNLFGKGNKLYGIYQYYDRNSVEAGIILDRIKGSKWGVALSLASKKTKEPLYFENGNYNFIFSYDLISVTAFHHFDLRKTLAFGSAYFVESYRRIDQGFIRNVPFNLDKNKVLTSVSYTKNYLNYHFFYLDGWHNISEIQMVNTLNNNQFFGQFTHEVKYFKSYERANFAARFRAGVSTHSQGAFAPFVLDSFKNVRGVGNRVTRGSAVFVMNIEYRHTLFDKKKLALQGVVFSDNGCLIRPREDVFQNKKDVENYVGGGLRIIYKKIFNGTIRTDYSFDLTNFAQNSFVLGLGQYF